MKVQEPVNAHRHQNQGKSQHVLVQVLARESLASDSDKAKSESAFNHFLQKISV